MEEFFVFQYFNFYLDIIRAISAHQAAGLFLLAYRQADREPSIFVKAARSRKCAPINVPNEIPNTILSEEQAKKLPSLLITNACSLIKKTDSLNGFLIDSKTNIAFVTQTRITNNNAQVIKSKFNKDYHVLSP